MAFVTGIIASAGCAMPRSLCSLLGAGYREEARSWREWLLRAIAGSPSQLQIMYGVRGERRLIEHELPWLRATKIRARCAWAMRPRNSSSSTCMAKCSTRCSTRSAPESK